MKPQIQNAVDANVKVLQLMLNQLCEYFKAIQIKHLSKLDRNTAIGCLMEFDRDISQINELIQATIKLQRSTESWLCKSDDSE